MGMRRYIFGELKKRGHILAKRMSFTNTSIKLPTITTNNIFKYYLFNATKNRVVSSGTFNSGEIITPSNSQNDELHLYIDVDITSITYLKTEAETFEWVDITDFTNLITINTKRVNYQNNTLISNTNNKVERLELYASKYLDNTINLSNFPKLEYCDIRGSYITTLDFYNNPLLTTVLANTQTITSINLTTNLKLKYLLFDGCKITGDLELSNRQDLYYVNFSNNMLNSFKAYNCPKLATIYFNGNKNMTSFKINNMNSGYIDAENCNISVLELPQVNKALRVWLDNNDLSGHLDLTSVMYGNFNNLKLQKNNLTSINLAMQSLVSFIDENGNQNFDIRNNPNLTCVQVRPQDLTWAQNNLTNKDAQTVFSNTSC